MIIFLIRTKVSEQSVRMFGRLIFVYNNTMKRKYVSGLVSLFFMCVLICQDTLYAQFVPYYPIEIFFNPCGYTNHIPGETNTEKYTTFSSAKIVLFKDLPSTDRFSNIVSCIGTFEQYHDFTKARDYNPFFANPYIRSHLFVNDIFTFGIEINGNIESMVGNRVYDNVQNAVKVNEVFQYINSRIRIRPFHYLILTPDLILQEIVTIGFSRNSRKTLIESSPDIYAYRDYNILKYEAKLVYLTKFHTRIFLSPFLFSNRYQDISVKNMNNKVDPKLPKLQEDGFGCALGFRYNTYKWGYTEGLVEVEKIEDIITAKNSYIMIKANAKWENQYFTERFGFMAIFEWKRYIFENPVQDFKNESNLDKSGTLARYEILADFMPIFNINRNVSIRPEYDKVYRKLPGKSQKTYNKNRFWVHIHILF